MPTVQQDSYEMTYDANVQIIRQLEAHLDMTDPKDYPLLKWVGLSTYKETITNTKVEWQRDYLIPQQDQLAEALDDSETGVQVDNGEYFQVNQVIMCENELMLVTAITAGTPDDLTVTRGFAGTTAAAHADNTPVYKLAIANPEASAAGTPAQVTTAQMFNYTQIWSKDAGVSGTEEAVKNYSPDDLLAYRMDARLMELYQEVERQLLYGYKYEGTATVGRSAGGLKQFITDQDDQSSAALGEAAIESAMANIFSRVGMANTPGDMWGNAWAKRRIDTFWQGIAQQDAARTTGGIIINRISTDFGSLDYHLDHLIKSDELWLLNKNFLFAGPLQGRSLHEVDASVNGTDGKKRRALGEYTFIIKGEDGTNAGPHCRIYGFATS